MIAKIPILPVNLVLGKSCYMNWKKQVRPVQTTTIPVSEIAPSAVKRAFAALDNFDTNKHLLAIANLAQMDHPAALVALKKALNHPNKSIRIAAAFNYPDRKDPRILPSMLEAYKDYDIAEFWYGQEGFSLLDTVERMGVVAVPTLLEFLQHGDSDVRCEAITALGWLKPANAIQPLRFFLQDDDEQIREAAVEALGKLRDKRVVDELTRLMQEGRSGIRGKAATALGNIGEKNPLSALRAALKVKAIEKDVILALGFLGNPDAIAELRKILHSVDADTFYSRYFAAISLLRMKDHAIIPDVVRALRLLIISTMTPIQREPESFVK